MLQNRWSCFTRNHWPTFTGIRTSPREGERMIGSSSIKPPRAAPPGQPRKQGLFGGGIVEFKACATDDQSQGQRSRAGIADAGLWEQFLHFRIGILRFGPEFARLLRQIRSQPGPGRDGFREVGRPVPPDPGCRRRGVPGRTREAGSGCGCAGRFEFPAGRRRPARGPPGPKSGTGLEATTQELPVADLPQAGDEGDPTSEQILCWNRLN